MILVVFGHHSFTDIIPSWYEKAHSYIYQFHMPMFMFLSGLLVHYSYKPVTSFESYKEYITKRFTKFFIPYFVIGLVLSLLIFFTNKPDYSYLIRAIWYLLLYPKFSESQFLWYLYVLFIFYLVSPYIFNISHDFRIIFLFISFCFTLLKFDTIFSADLIGRHLFFFLYGILVSEHYTDYCQFILKKGLLFIILFIFLSFLYIFPLSVKYIDIPFQLLSILGINAFLYLSSLIKGYKIRMIFVPVGVHTFYVYLLNMLIIQSYYYFLKVFGLFKSLGFNTFVVTSTLLAIIIPIFIDNGIKYLKKN